MPNYAITTSSPETRRLACLAVEVAALKLKTPAPPWALIVPSAAGPIEPPRSIRGMTRPRGDGRLELLIRCDQSPEKLVDSVFHECAHYKTIIDDLDRGGLPTERSISEGQAEWFAHSEAPTGSSSTAACTDPSTESRPKTRVERSAHLSHHVRHLSFFQSSSTPMYATPTYSWSQSR